MTELGTTIARRRPVSSPAAEEPSPRSRLRSIIPVVIFAAVAVGLVREGGSFDWGATGSEFRQTRLGWLALGLAVFYAGFLARCVRWQLLLANAGVDRRNVPASPSFGGLTGIMYRSWFVNSVTVARAGDAYRGFALKRRIGVSLALVLGTIVAERIVDLVVLSTLLIPAVAIVFRHHLPAGASWLFGLAVAVVVAGPILLRSLPAFTRLANRCLPDRLAAPATRLGEGAVTSLRGIPLLVLLSAVGWFGECLMLALAARAVGAHLAFVDAATVAMIAALLTTIPITPGGLGIAEAGIVVLLGRVGLDPAAATAVALLARAVSFGSVVVGGGLFWLAAAWSERRKRPPSKGAVPWP